MDYLRKRVTGQEPQGAGFSLALVQGWRPVRSQLHSTYEVHVFFVCAPLFSIEVLWKFHLPCCTEENNVLLCLLEPKGNRNFFVKNGKLGRGEGVGRAEVAVEI